MPRTGLFGIFSAILMLSLQAFRSINAVVCLSTQLERLPIPQ